MIKVDCELKDEKIYRLEVKGHADFAEYGKDLICASVSSIIFGLMNALDQFEEMVDIKNEKKVLITIKKSNEKIQDYLELVMFQLETIAEAYPKNIKIERR